jgi:two-component system, chemotaxis family, protein-glutamate methylesterase/glutaminase
MARDIIVVGASAGGVAALRSLFRNFKPEIPVSVFVVLHVGRADSQLPSVLGRQSILPVARAFDSEAIQPSRVYVAPPDFHLIVEFGHMHLTKGPKENRARPAINPMFRSAALAYGPRVIGIILSGTLDDGTLGLWEIKRRGGITLVQSPDDAEYEQMPDSAITNVQVDFQVPAEEMGGLLMKLVAESPQQSLTHGESVMSERTHLTCPDCHGPIDRFRFGDLTEFRCRVGHAFSQKGMLAAHEESEERALWSAVEQLEEGADLYAELGGNAANGGRIGSAAAKKKLAKTIREAIEAGKSTQLPVGSQVTSSND